MTVTDVPPARVLLVGMMGSGKSSVGNALARATDWPFIDNDALVARATGIVTPELLHERGERALRAAESGALTEALKIAPPIIAGVAGGVVTGADDRDRLRDGGFVVWLRARLETLVRRVGSGRGRPWLQGDPEGAMRRLYDGRESLYAEVAACVIDVDDATPEAVASRIVEQLREAPAARA
ncbi:MAG: shikimate kinase [Streptosporangiaceae bacterium]